MVNLTKSIEDYIEAIYIIIEKRKVARVKEIADLLKVSLPSVTGALSKLKDMGIIQKKRYGYVSLTEKGKKAALRIYNKHKVLFEFLTITLKVDEKLAIKEACAVEHCLSSSTIRKLDRLNKKNRRWIKCQDMTDQVRRARVP